MKALQDVVIISPCTFMRAGLEAVLRGLQAKSLRLCTTLAGPGVLMALSWADVLVLHVTARVCDEDGGRADTETALSMFDTRCRLVILCDPDCVSALATMPHLCARAEAVFDSAVTQHDLVACLQGMMICTHTPLLTLR